VELPEAFVHAVAEQVAILLRAEPQEEQETWLDVAGAAAHLGVPKSRIYRRVSQGRIPHVKDGARTFFSRAELDAWRRGGGR
jgi:excisionase family DNA binding protein